MDGTALRFSADTAHIAPSAEVVLPSAFLLHDQSAFDHMDDGHLGWPHGARRVKPSPSRNRESSHV